MIWKQWILMWSSLAKYEAKVFSTSQMGTLPGNVEYQENKKGFDWSDMAEEQVQTNMALMAFSDSESLDKLLGSQITDKSKKGLGYNVVPPPHPLIYNRPKKLDLSYSGLDEFKDPEFKSYGSKDKWIQVPRTKTYQAESDQKDKMRHAMDDNGIPSKEIHERHRERAITAEEEPDDTKPGIDYLIHKYVYGVFKRQWWDEVHF
ncbi:hypothetical protein Tco_1419083 [Tanacetum coccineum]